MSTHTFIVDVEVERDSGLFASRDDISERIEEALDEIENVDLTGLGAQGNSEYSVVSVSIDAVDSNTKAGRDALARYDSQVLADLPGDAELRKQNKALRAQLKDTQLLLNDAKDRNIRLSEAMEEQQKLDRTRIWYADPADRRQEQKRFIPDGKYDRVFFQYGERDDENISIELTKDGVLELHNQGWSQLIVVPTSSNVVLIRTEER